MFKSLRLKNFKAYKDTLEVPLAPLTIIIGKNNTGKSTLLQAILALAQTSENPSVKAFITKGEVDLNGFHDILHGKGERGKYFEISLSLDQEQQNFISQVYPWSSEKDEILADRLQVSFSLAPRSNEIIVKKTAFFAGALLLIECTSGGAGRSDFIDIAPSEEVRFDTRAFLPDFGWSSEDDHERRRELHKFGRSVAYSRNAWRVAFSNVHRIAPLRSRVPWYSGVGTTGTPGEDLISALGNKEPMLEGGTLREEVNRWVSGKLEILQQLRVKDIDQSGRVRGLFGDERHGMKDINIAAMGEGVSQLLPILEKAIALSPTHCLIVEQPEIHLHPALQADLGDLFIEAALRWSNQVIVETHSEHLLLRVRRRIAESAGKKKGLRPEDVSILFVDRVGGESKVTPLKLNGHGHFGDWPSGFFDDGYREAMALAMASTGAPPQSNLEERSVRVSIA